MSPVEPTFTLFGPRFKANPYPVYAEMRETMPVYRRVSGRGAGAVCYVTRYDDVAAILRDHRRFVKDIRNTLTPEERRQLPVEPELMRLVSRHMLNQDPPDHTRLRGLVNKAFTARMVEQMQGRIGEIAGELLRRSAGRRQMDLIEEFAFPLPIIVIAELLGIPARDRNRFRAWSKALVVPTASGERNAQKVAKAGRLMEDFLAYLRGIFAERRRAPQDDLITSLLEAEEAGEVLSEEELFSMLLLLIVVGHETSVNLIGNGLLSLLRHPAALAQVQADDTLLPSVVEEMVRYDCPVERAPMRFAAEDVQLHDVVIRRGDAVSLVLGSANRDPAYCDEPERFEPARLNNRHLGYGLGIHYCLGAALARVEGKVALAHVLENLPNLRLAEPVDALRWHTHPIMRGLHHLRVTWG